MTAYCKGRAAVKVALPDFPHKGTCHTATASGVPARSGDLARGWQTSMSPVRRTSRDGVEPIEGAAVTEPSVLEPYEERLGFTPMLAFCTVIFLAIGGFWGWMATDPQVTSGPAGWVFAVVTIVFFGGGGLSMLFGALRRQVALRVDEHGVTLGRPPGLMTHHGLWWRTPRVTVPWDDIDTVVLFSLNAPGSSTLSFVGLRLHDGAALPAREPWRWGVWRRLNMWMGQGRPPEDIDLYRQIFGWRVDEKRLRSAAKAYARGIPVMDRN
jgi:hypothetical protein